MLSLQSVEEEYDEIVEDGRERRVMGVGRGGMEKRRDKGNYFGICVSEFTCVYLELL